MTKIDTNAAVELIALALQTLIDTEKQEQHLSQLLHSLFSEILPDENRADIEMRLKQRLATLVANEQFEPAYNLYRLYVTQFAHQRARSELHLIPPLLPPE